MMMMNRTKSAVDALLKLRFKGICISTTRSFTDTPFSAGPPLDPNPCSSNVVEVDRQFTGETHYTIKNNVGDCSVVEFYVDGERLEQLTKEDVDFEFSRILEVVTPILDNQDDFYKKSCVSFINSRLIGLISEDKIHAAHLLNKIIKHKLCQPTTLLYNTVITALCDDPDDTMMDDALKLFQEMVSQPDVITYNSLVSGICQIRRWTKATLLLTKMLDKDISLDVGTFNLLIKTICSQGTLKFARHVMYMMRERGISPNIATYNLLIDAHRVKGHMGRARSLVNHMVSNHLAPDTATYISLLNGYCEDDTMDNVMLIYHEMNKKGFKPDCITYSCMIQSCFLASRFGDAYKLLDDVLAQGQTLNPYTYSGILYDLFRKHQQEAFSLFHYLGDDSKLNSDTSVIDVVLNGAIYCGKFDFARELFEGLTARGIKPTPHIYNTMISCFCEKGLVNDAKRLFLEMEENHCGPDSDTYDYLLQGYLNYKCYDDVKVLLYKVKSQKRYLCESTLSMLRASVAAGSLDATLSNLINNLA